MFLPWISHFQKAHAATVERVWSDRAEAHSRTSIHGVCAGRVAHEPRGEGEGGGGGGWGGHLCKPQLQCSQQRAIESVSHSSGAKLCRLDVLCQNSSCRTRCNISQCCRLMSRIHPVVDQSWRVNSETTAAERAQTQNRTQSTAALHGGRTMCIPVAVIAWEARVLEGAWLGTTSCHNQPMSAIVLLVTGLVRLVRCALSTDAAHLQGGGLVGAEGLLQGGEVSIRFPCGILHLALLRLGIPVQPHQLLRAPAMLSGHVDRALWFQGFLLSEIIEVTSAAD